jgi:hypothetical protein
VDRVVEEQETENGESCFHGVNTRARLVDCFFAGGASAFEASPGGMCATPEDNTADYNGAQAAFARLFGSSGEFVIFSI